MGEEAFSSGVSASAGGVARRRRTRQRGQSPPTEAEPISAPQRGHFSDIVKVHPGKEEDHPRDHARHCPATSRR